MTRCAIYCRKSSDDGLDQEFNSLDAQREAGESYIASQKHEGWQCIATRYADGGSPGAIWSGPASGGCCKTSTRVSSTA